MPPTFTELQANITNPEEVLAKKQWNVTEILRFVALKSHDDVFGKSGRSFKMLPARFCQIK